MKSATQVQQPACPPMLHLHVSSKEPPKRENGLKSVEIANREQFEVWGFL